MISTEDLEQVPEKYRELIKNVVPAEELTTNFKCQGCGIRCCRKETIGENVLFLPITLAYYREKRPDSFMRVLNRFLTMHIGENTKIPMVTTNAPMCPFLLLRWNQQNKRKFKNHIRTVKDPKIKKYLTSTLSKIIKTGKTEFTFDVLFAELNEHEDLFQEAMNSLADKKDIELQVATKLMKETLKTVNNFTKLLNTMNAAKITFECDVYEARPGACRAYPFGRLYTREKKVLASEQKEVDCPDEAFEGKKTMTVAEYFDKSYTLEPQDMWIERIFKMHMEHSDMLEDLPDELVEKMQLALFNLLYLTPKYSENHKIFYEELNKLLDQYVKAFMEIAEVYKNK